MTIKKQNQQNPPLPKSKRVDSLGNHRYRMFYKDGNSTMLFCKGITKPSAKKMIEKLNTYASLLGVKIEGTFIITH